MIRDCAIDGGDNRAAGTAAGPLQAEPLRLHCGAVQPEWIDYNGHMTEHRYLQVFGEASDALLQHIGIDAAMLARGRSAFTVETHISHLGELRRDEAFGVTTQVLAADAKRLHVFHSLHGDDGRLAATAEHMLLHVDLQQRRAAPAEPAVQAAATDLARAHAPLPRPPQAGRHIGASRR